MSHQGQKIAGRYELQALAGEGGMAKVWRALMHGAAGFSRVVAVKEIKAEFGAIQSYIDMFVEEARVGSDLAHPNIVQVYDFLEEGSSYYLVMEWVEGLDLESFLRILVRDDVAVSWELAAAVGLQVLRALGAAHERRRPGGVPAPVIHRDVSPPNVLLGANGTVKLTDFGLARARDRIYSLTAPGTVKGKLSYLSPEVTYGMPVTAMADLFSVGVVLWEMLTGRRLFEGPGDLDIFNQIRRCHVPPLRPLRPDVPERMAEAVHRALRSEPEQRFPTARAMAAELVAVLRETDAFADLQAFLAGAIAPVYRRHRGEDEKGGAAPAPPGPEPLAEADHAGDAGNADDEDDAGDEPTRPRVDLPGGFDPTVPGAITGPALLNRRHVEVEFSDSELTTLPELSPTKYLGRRATTSATEPQAEEAARAEAGNQGASDAAVEGASGEGAQRDEGALRDEARESGPGEDVERSE